jgi:cysteinyl-tRNA synthetase
VQRLADFLHTLPTARGESFDVQPLLQRTQDAFENAMDDDLNISGALGAIFEMVREVNRAMANDQLSADGARQVIALMHRFDTVLGLLTPDAEIVDSQVAALAIERQEARQRRDFARADALRDQLRELGFVVEDTPQGPRLKRL